MNQENKTLPANQTAEEMADKICLEASLKCNSDWHFRDDLKKIILPLTTALVEAREKLDNAREAFKIPRRHEMTGPKQDCGCAACNLHNSYRQERDQLQRELCEVSTKLASALGRIDQLNEKWQHSYEQLKSTIAELVKDKERLDWLEKQDFSFYGDSNQPAPFSLALQEDGCTTDIFDEMSLRSALDNAKGTK